MLTAELGRFRPLYAERRVLRASRVNTGPIAAVDHSFLRVLRAEFNPYFRPFKTKQRLRRASWVAAPLVQDANHPLLRVLYAELGLFCPCHAI